MRRFTIRRATVRDLKHLRHQRDGMFRDMGCDDEKALAAADRAYANWVRVRIRSGRFFAWLAVAPGNRVAAGGAVWLREQQPGPRRARLLPYLLSMYTEPEFRGKGLATKIVKAATAWGKKRRLTKMLLHASSMGRGVYVRLGWKRTWEMEIPLK
ncbi:MAG: GNAT family N-acetyltransferase [Planctomycetota bacterium]